MFDGQKEKLSHHASVHSTSQLQFRSSTKNYFISFNLYDFVEDQEVQGIDLYDYVLIECNRPLLCPEFQHFQTSFESFFCFSQLHSFKFVETLHGSAATILRFLNPVAPCILCGALFAEAECVPYTTANLQLAVLKLLIGDRPLHNKLQQLTNHVVPLESVFPSRVLRVKTLTNPSFLLPDKFLSLQSLLTSAELKRTHEYFCYHGCCFDKYLSANRLILEQCLNAPADVAQPEPEV